VSVPVKDKLFSFSAIAIAVGAAGFVSAVVTMFVDTSQQYSVRVIIFLVWLFLSILVVLIKIINDLSNIEITQPTLPREKPIKILSNGQLILIRKNDLFINNAIVGCYCVEDDFESLIYIAVVSHVQDNFLQVKVIADFRDDRAKQMLTTRGVDCMVIRPTIPYEALTLIGADSND
jgi:hypothetical protein